MSRRRPFLEHICDIDENRSGAKSSWPAFWCNVYPTGYGYPRPTRDDAELFRSFAQPILYRIKVIRK